MTKPFNQILHDNLITRGYKYEEHPRYDKYIKNESVVIYYMNGYIVMIEGDDVAQPEKYQEIARDISKS